VARRENERHWANTEKAKPIYNGMEDCPKVKNIDELILLKEEKNGEKIRRTRGTNTKRNGTKQRI